MKTTHTSVALLSIAVATFFSSCQREPSACFKASDETIEVGDEVTFTNCTDDGNSYEWNFGDNEKSTDESPKHSFATAGMYTVIMTAKSKNGRKTNESNIKITVTDDDALAENVSNDVNNISDEGAGSTGSTLSSYKIEEVLATLATCAVVTRDTTIAAPARKTTIDFGTTNCLCRDQKNRRGKIIINSSKQFWLAGVTHTVTFDQFFVEDNGVTGTKTTTYNGKVAGNHNWSISESLTIALSAANGGGTITRNSTRTRVMTAGASTAYNWTDDEYTITGTASGTRRSGSTYSATTVSPLLIKIGCRHITQGSIDFMPSGKPTRTIDYGTGTCDDDATVTVNGVSRAIKL